MDERSIDCLVLGHHDQDRKVSAKSVTMRAITLCKNLSGYRELLLNSIFKNDLLISFIQNYFNNSETPIICYKYNKPIRSTIFNFNKIVIDIDIDSITPDSWDCQNSNYLYISAGHVITGNLNVIPDNIISKGPK